jgi:antitoxin component of RelBE/YafQ-DinJ toxin-antitoxin module
MPDTPKKAIVAVRVSRDLHEQVHAAADDRDATLSDLLRRFLRELADESA